MQTVSRLPFLKSTARARRSAAPSGNVRSRCRVLYLTRVLAGPTARALSEHGLTAQSHARGSADRGMTAFRHRSVSCVRPRLRDPTQADTMRELVRVRRVLASYVPSPWRAEGLALALAEIRPFIVY